MKLESGGVSDMLYHGWDNIRGGALSTIKCNGKGYANLEATKGRVNLRECVNAFLSRHIELVEMESTFIDTFLQDLAELIMNINELRELLYCSYSYTNMQRCALFHLHQALNGLLAIGLCATCKNTLNRFHTSFE